MQHHGTHSESRKSNVAALKPLERAFTPEAGKRCCYTVHSSRHLPRRMRRKVASTIPFFPFLQRRHAGDLFPWQSWARICTATRLAPRHFLSTNDTLRTLLFDRMPLHTWRNWIRGTREIRQILRLEIKRKLRVTRLLWKFSRISRLKMCQALVVLCLTNCRLHRSEQSIGGYSTHGDKSAQHTEQIFKPNFLKNQTLSETIFLLCLSLYFARNEANNFLSISRCYLTDN